jgi:hypothetical protein
MALGGEQDTVLSAKTCFLNRFLLIGVPYHSQYLDGVTDVVEEDLEE